ncbi:Hint domain-containing protein [Acetobacter pasteurianus]|uniref:Hint domain-containing protein n=1 Tax=Acetobacter pasteurianus TaxID=438 RepID=UPI001362F1B2|nr:Hint domain-containing protein [Acetobacter pasteurianus]QHM91887.1 Hint domain-containing protein [Acetobacter pasteurianus]
MTDTFVSSGQTVSDVTVSGGNQLVVQSGGTANNVTVMSNANAAVSAGGILSGATVSSIGGVGVQGTAYNVTVQNGGVLDEQSGGYVDTATISSGASLYVSNATIVDSVILGSASFSGGVTANNDTVGSTGVVTLSGSAAIGGIPRTDSLTVESGGTVNATYYAALQGTTVENGATVNVSTQAEIIGSTVNGTVNINSGGYSFSTDYASSSVVNVNSGGESFSDIFNSGAKANVSGGTVLSASINSNSLIALTQGGVVSASTVNSGANVTIDSKAQFDSNTVSGGTITMTGFNGFSINNDYLSGAHIYISGVNSLNSDTIESGATASLTNSGVTIGVNLYGQMTLDSGSWAVGGSVASGGVMDVKNDSIAYNAGIASGGTVNVDSTATISGASVQSGGTLNINSGATLADYTASGSSTVTTVGSGGTLTVANGGTLSGTVQLADGATMTIPTSAGGTIDLQGNTNVGLIISGTGSVNTVISGFDGTSAGQSDGITLASVQAADVTNVSYPDDNHVTFTLKDGSSVELNIVGVTGFGYNLVADANGDLVYEVCFLAGSMIRTPHGDVNVEDIRMGDEVIAYVDGQQITRKVTWAGKAHGTVRPDLADDEAGYPVRILKDAIATGVPYKDMLITPEHCLFFDGKFVPARMLVNGVSVFYDKSITSYDYYHVETEQHSVIVADGMLTESYLDTGNRQAFRQEGSVVRLCGASRSWEDDAAAPLCVEQAFVEPIFRAIENRAGNVEGAQVATVSPQLTTDPDLYLITETGQIIRNARVCGKNVMFMLPAGVKNVQIVSRVSRPSDAVGPFLDDRRKLGVLIGKITLLDGNKMRDVTSHLEGSDLTGWYAQDQASNRWTNGKALLPLDNRQPYSFGMLSVEVLAAGPYVMACESQLHAQIA